MATRVIPTFWGNDGTDHLNGGPGADHQFGGRGADVLLSGGGALGTFGDNLHGGAGDDQLVGDETRQQLTGGAGDDSIAGGGAVDQLLYTGARNGVAVNLATGRARGQGSDRISGVENVVGSMHGDELVGNSTYNVLIGGQVRLGHSEESGDDVLRGGAGADYLGDVTCLGSVPGDTRTCSDPGRDGEFGGPGRDVLSTSGGRDFAGGGRGPDSLFLAKGHARMVGGRGRDLFKLRKGRGRINGGAGRDTIQFVTVKIASERPPLSPARVDLATGHAANGHVTAQVPDIEVVRATRGADEIAGDAERNFLYGLGGNDSVRGRAGADYLSGGAGNDSLRGGRGSDKCVGGETTSSCES